MQHEIRHLSEANFNKIKNAVKDILEALAKTVLMVKLQILRIALH